MAGGWRWAGARSLGGGTSLYCASEGLIGSPQATDDTLQEYSWVYRMSFWETVSVGTRWLTSLLDPLFYLLHPIPSPPLHGSPQILLLTTRLSGISSRALLGYVWYTSIHKDDLLSPCIGMVMGRPHELVHWYSNVPQEPAHRIWSCLYSVQVNQHSCIVFHIDNCL